MSKKFLTLSNIISVVIISSLSTGVFLAFADWSAPPTAPPECPASEPGCNLPLNVSGAGQIKAGGLTLGANLNPSDIGLIVLNGNVGVGTANPGEKLSVAGIIESTSGGIKFPDETIQATAATTRTYIAGTDTILSMPTLRGAYTDYNWVRIKWGILAYPGTVSASFQLAGRYFGQAQIRRNGVAVGAEATNTGAGWSFSTHTEDISGWSAGDTIELWYRSGTGDSYVRVQNFTVSVTEPVVTHVVQD